MTKIIMGQSIVRKNQYAHYLPWETFNSILFYSAKYKICHMQLAVVLTTIQDTAMTSSESFEKYLFILMNYIINNLNRQFVIAFDWELKTQMQQKQQWLILHLKVGIEFVSTSGCSLIICVSLVYRWDYVT